MYQKFNIRIEKANDTLRVTTKKGIIHSVHPLNSIYIVDNMQLKRNRLNVQLYTEHLLYKTKSLEGNTGSWIYTTGKFTLDYPFKNHSEAGYTLRMFADYVGIPDRLISDLVPEITENIKSFRLK